MTASFDPTSQTSDVLPSFVTVAEILEISGILGVAMPPAVWSCWHWGGQGRPPIHSKITSITAALERFDTEAGGWQGLALHLDSAPILFNGANTNTLVPVKLTPAAVRARIMEWASTQGEPQLDTYRGTDDANSDLFLALHGENVRYCPPWEKWLLWTGTHWRIDDNLRVDQLAADVPRDLYRRAADAMDSKDRRAIADLARKLENSTRRGAMLTATRHRVVVHHSDLDRGHFLLNCRNGTVDLTAGTLQPHARTDLLTHDTEIDFNLSATSPTWQQFLQDVFNGDDDLIRFLQRAVGYSLTGDVREQVLLICHGTGSNGKSVFLNILRRLVGNLAWQAAPDLLLQDKSRRHPTERAALFGKRLIVCQETGEGRRFDEVMVKQLTGGDIINARRMHEDEWQFAPTHTIWLSTNHRPSIKGTDHAIWRRVRMIPFLTTFRDDGTPAKDSSMENRLLAELPGILAWAVCGCLDWQQHGLGQADAVRLATEAYRSEMDVLAAWLADCCVVSPDAKVRASDLYRSYVGWGEDSGERPEPQRTWGMRLTERGFTRFKVEGKSWWRGLGLVDHVDHVDQKTTISPPPTSCDPKTYVSWSTSSTSSTKPKPEETRTCRDCDHFRHDQTCDQHADAGGIRNPDQPLCSGYDWRAVAG